MSVTSVQDLIAAAKNNNSSPFMSLMEGATQGFGQALREAPQRRLQNLEAQKMQLAINQQQAEVAYQEQAKKELTAKLAGQVENGTKSNFYQLNKSALSTPAEKMKEEISLDERGNVSKKYKFDEPKAVDKTKVDVTPEMAAKFPQHNLVVGSQIPSTFLSENSAAQQARSDKQKEARITAMGKDLDPTQARAGQFGVSQQIFNRAERLSALASAIPDGNLDSRQVEELAVGLNAMLSGSNTGAQEQVKALVPQSAIGNANKLAEWLSNNPRGTGQVEFVKRMMGSIEREKATAQDQINRVQFQRLARYEDVRKQDAGGWENTVRSYGLDPTQYDAWKKGGYKQINAGANQPEGSKAPHQMTDAEILSALGH